MIHWMCHDMHQSTCWKLQETPLKCVLVDWATHSLLLYHPWQNPWVSTMTSLLCHATSWWGSSHFKQVIQSAAFPPRHTHAPAYELQNIWQIPHSSSSFWWGNILHVLVTLYSWIHFTSVFFVSVLMVSLIMSFISHVLSDNILCIMCFVSLHVHKVTILGLLTFQMTAWSFRDALVELKVKNCFDKPMLQSTQGLCMGDIYFTEIQTTFKMCTVSFHLFLQFIEKGCFNPNKLPEDGYSHTTTGHTPGLHPRPISCGHRCVGIGNLIWRHRSPLGGMCSIDMVISHIRVVLAIGHDKPAPKCRAYMMLIGNYGGHMAFTMDLPYCIAYAAEYKHTDNPSRMTFHEPSNHGFAMTASNLVVQQLLSVVNWNPAERKLTTGGHLLILRGVQFGPRLFPNLVMPCNHAAPLIDSSTCQEVPFQMVGPFWAMDPVFPGLPGDLELFTAEEVAKLKELGVLNPPDAPGHLPLFPPLVSSSRGKSCVCHTGCTTSRFWYTGDRTILGSGSGWGVHPLQ